MLLPIVESQFTRDYRGVYSFRWTNRQVTRSTWRVNFEFATATRIVFGAGRLREMRTIAPSLGRRALVVIGKSAGAVKRVEPLLSALTDAGVEYATFSVAGEPTLDVVRTGTQRVRDERCDFVIGFGGGSPIDTGKAIAVLQTNEGDPLDYVELIGKGKEFTKAALPYVAIPTTAGTGSEVTRNAVLGSQEHHVKVSLRSPLMLPRVALVDPELTYDLPPQITATTGLDALTQLIEPFVSVKANPMTDAICREGMQRVARSLRRAYGYPSVAEIPPSREPRRANRQTIETARKDMCVAQFVGRDGAGERGAGRGARVGGAVGGMFDAPHGALCAALLPYVMETNRGMIRGPPARRGSSPTEIVKRFEEVAQIVGDTGNWFGS